MGSVWDTWYLDSRNNSHVRELRGCDRDYRNYEFRVPLVGYKPRRLADCLSGMTPLDPYYHEVHDALGEPVGDCAIFTVMVLSDTVQQFGYVHHTFMLFKNADDAMFFKLRWNA